MSPSADIIIQQCSTFNLRGISVIIPRTGWTLVCGPAGSGKSALLHHSLAVESARRLGRIAFSTRPGSTIGGMITQESSHGFEINSVAPVVDLSYWLSPQSSPRLLSGRSASSSERKQSIDQSIAISLGLDQAVSRLFSTHGRPLCAKRRCLGTGATLLRRTPAAVAAQLAGLPGAAKSGKIGTFAICGVLESERGLQKVALEAFEAGHRRFVVDDKYFRSSDLDQLKSVLSAINSSSKPLFVVLKTMTVSEVADSGSLLTELESSLTEAAAEWKNVVVLPRAAEAAPIQGGGFLSASGISVADGLYQCDGCGRTVVLPTLSNRTLNAKNQVDIELNGFRLSSIFSVSIGADGGLSNFFASLKPDDFELPGVRSGSDLVSNFVQSGLSQLVPDQPASSLSTGERLLLVLSGLISEAGTGAIYLLSHSVGFLASADRVKILNLIGRIVAEGNAVVLEERRIERFAGLSAGSFLELGPAGGRRGGEVINTGQLASLQLSNADVTERRIEGERKVRGLVKVELKGKIFQINAGSVVRISGEVGSGKSVLVASLEQGLVSARRRTRNAKTGVSEAFFKTKTVVEWASDVARMSQLALFSNGAARRNERFATRLGVEQQIAALYAETTGARRAGFASESFVVGSVAERCSGCGGKGEELVDLAPFGRVQKRCVRCEGTGRSPGVLAIEYRGKSFASALNSEVEELLELFSSRRHIVERLKAAVELDLGHLSLISSGQTFTVSDGVVIDLVALWSDHAASTRRRKPIIALIDQPIFDRSYSAAVRLTALLSSIAAVDGLVIYTDPSNESGHPNQEIRL